METCIGRVTHYFNHISVAVLAITQNININNMVHIIGHTTDLTQRAWSLEINHRKVQSAGPGTEIALKVAEPVHKGDWVFLVTEESSIPKEPMGM